MTIFSCKMCGGHLEISSKITVCKCEYCGTMQTLPQIDDEKREKLYERANHFRRNNEFDKAMGIYEEILNEDDGDAEAYWSLILCSYGIEYVEEPATGKRIPTINRAQLTSIFDDDNYKSALKYADSYQKEIYEQEAKTINKIQKSILAISQQEEPFDIFICYKETDANGRRTPDSVLAQDLYKELTQEGYKVFFSRITLEDKLGTAYEPYIFAALNSAKVMIVVGTKAEYFNAVWVKNEWSRYLALMKKGEKKRMLIPSYRDMDPYDLPEEFSHLQGQDMSKLGFMQDLVRGIRKIIDVKKEENKIASVPIYSRQSTSASTVSLLDRAFLFIEDSNWRSADTYLEKVLDIEPRNSKAYLGKLMIDFKVSSEDALNNVEYKFDFNDNFKKAYRFADENTKEKLKGIKYQGIYNLALSQMRSAKTEADYKSVAEEFAEISFFRDSKEMVEKCLESAEKANRENRLLSCIKQIAYQKEKEEKRIAEEEAKRIAFEKEEEARLEQERKKKIKENLKRQEEENERIAQKLREQEQIRQENERRKKIKNDIFSSLLVSVIQVVLLYLLIKGYFDDLVIHSFGGFVLINLLFVVDALISGMIVKNVTTFKIGEILTIIAVVYATIYILAISIDGILSFLFIGGIELCVMYLGIAAFCLSHKE